MRFDWKDYAADTMPFVEDWLDDYAVRMTGLDDGWGSFHEYWITEGGMTPGKDYWCKVVYDQATPFAVIAFSLYDETYTIMELLVKPEIRGNGIGTSVLHELILCGNLIFGNIIEKATAVIFPNNPASQKAFEKAGFVFDHANEESDVWYYSYRRYYIRKTKMSGVHIKTISKFTPDMLTDFAHAQKWSEQWTQRNGAWILESAQQFRIWSEEKRIWIPKYLQEQIERGGNVFGAFKEEKLVGFAAHDAPIVIDGIKWVNLTMLFVDDGFARCGIGASLFNEITKSAKENGVGKLFVSAIPSKETVAFYFSQGCVDATVVIEAFVDTKEDRYLEYTV